MDLDQVKPELDKVYALYLKAEPEGDGDTFLDWVRDEIGLDHIVLRDSDDEKSAELAEFARQRLLESNIGELQQLEPSSHRDQLIKLAKKIGKALFLHWKD